MTEVRLCTDCKFRAAWGSGGTFVACGAFPTAKRLKDARDQCKGEVWQGGVRIRLATARNLYE